MRKNVVDAGVIIAFIDCDDTHHDWAVSIFSTNETLATCEAVISEACARLEYGGFKPDSVIQLVADGILTLEFSAKANIIRILRQMEKYADRPMDFADACLVVMTEAFSDPMLFTLDDDFRFYRRHGRDTIPFVSPRR
ncbi:MAG TPA: PIN domain-containing protein [Verrucomicrobiae bacterium]|nr:PIN domain-containing protein [Verrucomicrobiae bacterium]